MHAYSTFNITDNSGELQSWRSNGQWSSELFCGRRNAQSTSDCKYLILELNCDLWAKTKLICNYYALKFVSHRNKKVLDELKGSDKTQTQQINF